VGYEGLSVDDADHILEIERYSRPLVRLELRDRDHRVGPEHRVSDAVRMRAQVVVLVRNPSVLGVRVEVIHGMIAQRMIVGALAIQTGQRAVPPEIDPRVSERIAGEKTLR
jgi:hypothetical protein